MIPPPPVILSFGEVLWDLFPEGERLGGAPANLAYHLCQLRCDGRLVSAVGEDDEGMRAIVELRDQGLDVSLVGISEDAPTGRVDIEVSGSGDATYRFLESPAWETIESSAMLVAACTEARAVVFGSLALRSERNRATLDKMLEVIDREDTLVVFDVNLRPPSVGMEEIRKRIDMVDLLKVNREEAILLLGDSVDEGASGAELLEALHQSFQVDRILLTLDADGAMYMDRLEQGDAIVVTPLDLEEDIVDTVGAGDSFLAAVIEGICRHRDLGETMERATTLASYVVRMTGAIPGYSDEMLEVAEG